MTINSRTLPSGSKIRFSTLPICFRCGPKAFVPISFLTLQPSGAASLTFHARMSIVPAKAVAQSASNRKLKVTFFIYEAASLAFKPTDRSVRCSLRELLEHWPVMQFFERFIRLAENPVNLPGRRFQRCSRLPSRDYWPDVLISPLTLSFTS